MVLATAYSQWDDTASTERRTHTKITQTAPIYRHQKSLATKELDLTQNELAGKDVRVSIDNGGQGRTAVEHRGGGLAQRRRGEAAVAFEIITAITTGTRCAAEEGRAALESVAHRDYLADRDYCALDRRDIPAAGEFEATLGDAAGRRGFSGQGTNESVISMGEVLNALQSWIS